MLLKIEKKGGGLPLLAAPCRVFQHPLERALNRRARNARASLLPSLKNSAPAQPAPHAHMAVPECSLSGQAFAVAFLL